MRSRQKRLQLRQQELDGLEQLAAAVPRQACLAVATPRLLRLQPVVDLLALLVQKYKY